MATTTDRINALLDQRYDRSPVQVWPAVVKSVQGGTCTVDVLGTGLTEVEGVLLRADENATEGVGLTPAVGSLVLAGLIQNEISNLYVAQCSEVTMSVTRIGDTEVTVTKDFVEVVADQSRVLVTKNGLTLTQQQTEVKLSGGKVSVTNAGGSLRAILDEIIQTLTTLTVICAAPGSPSVPNPAVVASLTATKAKLALLLS